MNCSKGKTIQILTAHCLTTFATNIIEACKIPKEDMQPSESGHESF